MIQTEEGTMKWNAKKFHGKKQVALFTNQIYQTQ